MDNISESVGKLGDVPACIKQYMSYVSLLEYSDQPDYNKLRKLFTDEKKRLKLSSDTKLVFPSVSFLFSNEALS